jgi:hypothetical protein
MSAQNNYLTKRDSFSDGICDDLCEVLLKYLSFEDKIKFECVSKQFQRCVYNKHNILKIDFYCNYNLLERSSVNKYEYKLNAMTFKNILNKFKFINKITIHVDITNSEEILLLIGNNCKHLKSIDFNFNAVKEKVLVEFGLKCGQQLRKISFYGDRDEEHNNFRALLNLCPNVSTINNFELIDFIDDKRVLIPKVTQIKRLKINERFELMEVLANDCANILKSLHIINSDYSDHYLNSILKQISRFVSLEKLRLHLYCDRIISKTFVDNMRNIGIKCTKINDLDMILYYEIPTELSDLSKMFETFTHLKVLTLNSHNDSQKISIKSLENCNQLTQLTLTDVLINDKFFEDIDQYLPQLKLFDVSTDEKISNIALNSLSKLNKLKSIELNANYSKSITDKEIINFVNNCQEIETIKLFEANITHKTIDALIELALKRPRIQFINQFATITMKNNHKRTAIYQNEIDLPNNLIITIDEDSNKWKKFYFKT